VSPKLRPNVTPETANTYQRPQSSFAKTAGDTAQVGVHSRFAMVFD
jgi:hypothetical protein